LYVGDFKEREIRSRKSKKKRGVKGAGGALKKFGGGQSNLSDGREAGSSKQKRGK